MTKNKLKNCDKKVDFTRIESLVYFEFETSKHFTDRQKREKKMFKNSIRQVNFCFE